MDAEKIKISDSPLSAKSSRARNRFVVLDSVMEREEESLANEVGVVDEEGAIGVRKSKATVIGVTDLMRRDKERTKAG